MAGLFDRLAARAGTTPPPNPFSVHPNDDPDHGTARAARGWYTNRVAEIRADPMMSDLAKTQALAAAHRQHTADMAQAHGRLTARRQARLDYLTGLVPSGPDVPEGTSAADRAVLLSAWRAALTAVRQAPDRQARAALLADAQKYGDDTMQRALIAHATETGDARTVDRWVQDTHGVTGWQTETGQLRGALDGTGPRPQWDWSDFHAEPAPKEARGLSQFDAGDQGAA